MNYLQLAQAVIRGKRLSFREAFSLISARNGQTFELLAAAGKIKQAFKGDKIQLCSIVNAKSGKCSENCTFCAQSVHHQTHVKTYPLLSVKEIFGTAKKAEKEMRATCFSIVTSGRTIRTERERETIRQAIGLIGRRTKMRRCVSLGILSLEEIIRLKAGGLTRLHHNLETAESFFPRICTTHSYAMRVETVKNAKKAGLEVCSGGIFGLGETLQQRIELALALRKLEVDSVPINILNPIPGTPAARKYKPIGPLEVLRLIATYRFILPRADIGIFGGRELALRHLQPLMFVAGANITLTGDYLTTKGQSPGIDRQMIADLGLGIGN